MKATKLLSALVVFGMLLGLVTACAGEPSPTAQPTAAPAATSGSVAPAPTAQPTAAPAATTAKATAAPPAAANAWQGKPAGWTEASATKSFTYHVSSACPSLAKWAGTSNNTIRVISYLVFDPVIVLDEAGNPTPWLAKSWTFGPDSKSITFQLRDDVYFSDGTKFTADDLIFTFEQVRDDTKHYPDSNAKNLRAYIGEMKKIDDYQFTLNFAQPMPEFWYQITDSSLQVVCKSAYQKMGYDAYWQKPVGTGPYVVESWDQPNSIVKLTLRTDKNGYWGYKATNRYTNVKNVTIKYSPEAQTRLASLRSGEVQMIDTIGTADKPVLDKEGFVTTVMPPVNTVFLLTTSGKGKVFDNQKLRQALSLSIDRKLIVDALLSGFGIPISWPSLPGVLGYEDKKAIVYDKAKAAQLVKESGYDGRPIDFIYTPSTVNIGNELTQAIQSMAGEVGINLKIRPLEAAVYNDASSKGDYDLRLGAIGYSGNAWYKLGHDAIGSDRFATGHQNKAGKDLANSLGSIIDPVEADKVYKQLWENQTTTFEPVIFLYWPTLVNAWSAKVTGVLLHANQFPDLSNLVIKD